MTAPASTDPSRRVSIVIVAWGKRPVTERCLAIIDEVLGAEIGGRFELVLVDNASPDDTAELFEAWRDRAKVVLLPSNRNFAGGCNAGAGAASGDVLIFLNNDVDVTPGALENLADQVREDGVGAAGARLLYPDGTLQHAGVAMLGGGDIVVPHHIFHHMDGALPAARATFEVDVVTGACLAIRRDVFMEAGGFDEAFANGWEDVDLCLHVRSAGWTVVYRGDVAMVHDEGRTRGEVRGADANARHFYSRWRGLLDADDEFAAQTFDARLPRRSAAAARRGGPVVLAGHITALGPAGDEARALLSALEGAGLEPAGREAVPAFIEPRLEDPEWDLVQAARARQPAGTALAVSVPDGRHAPAVAGSVVRLADLPAGDLAEVRAVWAASPRLAAALVDGGFDPQRIEVLPPPVEAPATGSGGEGILVVLPTHDTAACAALLDALAPLAGVGIRLVPTVGTRKLDALVASRLRDAKLLPPCSSERRFARLAACADVVVACDADDRYARRALIAAAAGAPTVTAAGRPAGALVPAAVHEADPYDPGSLRAAMTAALEAQPLGREARARHVLEVCGVAATAARLGGLVDRAAREQARAA